MKKLVLLLVVSFALGVLSACATPTPQIVEKVVEVEKTVVVEKVVEKPVEKVIQKKVEVLVTATPVPEPDIVTLNANLGGEPPQADPALATDSASILIDEQMFLGLTDFDDKTNEVIPELATEWSVSEDGLTWTFKMRDDVPWVRYNPATGQVEQVLDEDGNPRIVNAHEVEYAVKRTLNPETGSDYAYVLYIIKGGEALNTAEEVTQELLDAVGVKALDDFTVEFTLEAPAAYFPGIASMWVARPVPPDLVEEKGDRWIEPGIIWTNGPYIMTEWIHGASMTMVKNPFFYGWDEPDAGNIERIEWVMIEEASTEMALYENNQVDTTGGFIGWGVPLPDLDRVRADPVLSKEYSQAPELCTYYYGFTMTKPPVDNVLVRKALSAAIDRETLVETVTKGGQIPAHSFAPPGIFGNVADDLTIGSWMLDYEEGKELAKEWMTKAGYPDGEGLDIILMHNVSEGHARIAQAIQAMWQELFPKAKFTIETQEWKVYLQTLKKDTPVEEMPHVWRLGWCADYADQNNWVHEVFNAEEGANRPRATPSKFEELTKQAQIETDPEKRKELYREAERILVEEEARIAPIYYYTTNMLTKPWLKRTVQALGGQHIDKWTIDWEAKKAAIGR
jgi:oligopeptide transport system substrate-binding protein